MTNHPYKGWYTARKIPHFDAPHTQQSVTFRLGDALPQSVLREIHIESRHIPDNKRENYQRRRIEEWLDRGIGCCVLRHPEVAEVMCNALKHYHNERYRLLAWCVMPNHVHVVIEPNYPLSRIVQNWKSYTAHWTRQQTVQHQLDVPPGKFWMRGYWDRYIRNPEHLQTVLEYVHQNPVKAGLCDNAEEWRWSSAHPDSRW